MKRLILNLVVAASLLLSSAALFLPAHSYASPFSSSSAKDQACAGISGDPNAGNCTTPGKSVSDIIRTILNFLSAIVGIIAVIMVIVAGFKYISSGGDSSKVTSAKNTLVYAIVGLIIVALAQAITQFVLNKAVAPTKTPAIVRWL